MLLSASRLVHPAPPRAIGLVRIPIGLLLLCAGTLKGYALWSDTAQPAPIFASFRAQLAITEVEALLGLWLLTGLYLHLAWLAAIVVFFSLTSASLYLLIIGEASCGCFGTLRVHPWYSFALDSICLGLLVTFFPTRDFKRTLIRELPALGRWLLGVTAVATILLVVSFMWFDSPAEALNALRGDRISLEPSVLEFGNGMNADFKAATVTLWNRTDQPVRVVGGSADCSCVTTDDLPITIPAQSPRLISIRLRYPGQSTGFFAHRAWLMTDDPIARRLTLHLSGRVVANK